MFHPIHYSLAINAMILVGAGVLAWVFTQPLLFVIALMVLQHAIGRFEPDRPPAPEGGPGMGFLANIGGEDDD
jgi:hypothetical protein